MSGYDGYDDYFDMNDSIYESSLEECNSLFSCASTLSCDEVDVVLIIYKTFNIIKQMVFGIQDMDIIIKLFIILDRS